MSVQGQASASVWGVGERGEEAHVNIDSPYAAGRLGDKDTRGRAWVRDDGDKFGLEGDRVAVLVAGLGGPALLLGLGGTLAMLLETRYPTFGSVVLTRSQSSGLKRCPSAS